MVSVFQADVSNGDTWNAEEK